MVAKWLVAVFLVASDAAHACDADQVAGAWIDGDGYSWTFRLGQAGGGNFIDLAGPADTPFVRAFGEPILWRVVADGRIRVLTVAPGDYDAVGTPEVLYRCEIRDGAMRWTDGNGPPVTFRPAQPG